MYSEVFSGLIPAYTYCESATGGFPQPLNFLSCLVFLITALWMNHTRAEDDESPSFAQVTAVLLFLLGLSGMAWHVGGHPVALAADMFFLFMLFIVMAVVVSNDILRLELGRGLAVVMGLILASALLKEDAIGRLPQHGAMFLPLLFFLALAALKVQGVCGKATVYLLTAAYLLFFGLLAHSADGALCKYFPHGFHFIWHITVAAAVFYTGRALTAMKVVPWPEETAARALLDPAATNLGVTITDQDQGPPAGHGQP